MINIPDNPKAALEAFLMEIYNDYYIWYAGSVNWLRRWWRLAAYVQIISGFAAALLAAVATEDWFRGYGLLRVLLIVLPALTAAATVAVAQSHLYERYQLREEGRRAMQHLWNVGRQRFARAKTAEEYASIHQELASQVDEVEKQQGDNFFNVIKKSPDRPKEKVQQNP